MNLSAQVRYPETSSAKSFVILCLNRDSLRYVHYMQCSGHFNIYLSRLVCSWFHLFCAILHLILQDRDWLSLSGPRKRGLFYASIREGSGQESNPQRPRLPRFLTADTAPLPSLILTANSCQISIKSPSPSPASIGQEPVPSRMSA